MPFNALHEALCSDTPSLAVVKALSTQHPEYLMEKDEDGDAPLFSSLCHNVHNKRNRICPEVIQVLIDACPDASRFGR